jgi:hypothetical protein
MTKSEIAKEATRKWVEKVVVAYQLCPFAKVPFQQQTIRYCPVQTTDTVVIKKHVLEELQRLDGASAKELETTLLVLTEGFSDFFDFWDLVGLAENWLADEDYTGVYQIASFHPEYIFAGTQTHDAQNYTNRSPFPTLHLIREDSLEKAIASYPNIEEVPKRNIQLMEEKGKEHWVRLLKEIRE